MASPAFTPAQLARIVQAGRCDVPDGFHSDLMTVGYVPVQCWDLKAMAAVLADLAGCQKLFETTTIPSWGDKWGNSVTTQAAYKVVEQPKISKYERCTDEATPQLRLVKEDAGFANCTLVQLVRVPGEGCRAVLLCKGLAIHDPNAEEVTGLEEAIVAQLDANLLAAVVPVCLLRRNGSVVAFEDWCTHLGGPLSEGQLVDGRITCPWHGSSFAVDSGAVSHGPATMPVRSFATRVRDGRIEVQARPR